MLKILSVSVATAALIASLDPAYAFDNERFYTYALKQMEADVSRLRPEENFQVDQFVLGSSGRIDKIPRLTVMNTVGIGQSSNQTAGGDGAERRSDTKPLANMNISYSSSSLKSRLNDKCGPSPMTATEIEELVGRTAQTYGVDPRLAKAVAWVESRFNEDRNSDQGARGTMQLMPGTALELGVGDICDPPSNIDGGVRYLKRMLDEFQNPILAAAAYNAGAQAVYDNGGVPPFAETIRYVAAVINHQMGLQIPRKSSARGVAFNSEPTLSDEIATDVIGARGSRFVKGVMQF